MASSLSWSQYILFYVLVGICGLTGSTFGFFMFLRHPILFFKRTKRVTPPDCMLDPTLGKRQYAVANGIKFHYVTTGDPSKPLLLLLHGFPEFWYSWRHQLKEFSGDYHVVAVDLRGYNKTDRPPRKQDYALPVLCQDIKELVSVLGHDKANLVGHDWGGAVAWETAHRHPQVVERLIVMNCPHTKIFRQRIRNHRSQFQKSLYAFLFQIPWLPEFLFSANDYNLIKVTFRGRLGGVKNRDHFTANDVEAYKYVFSQKGALTFPLNYYRANAIPLAEDKGLEGKVVVPALIIWGDQDLAFDLAMVESHGEIVEDLTVRHLENCSHWVQNDDPEEVNRHMREFLERDF